MLDTNEDKSKFYQLANQYLESQLKSMRWRMLLRYVLFGLFLIIILVGLFTSDDKKAKYTKPHVAMIDIKGMIAEDQKANADALASSLVEVGKNPGAKAVILRISSPGGSPVQASYMYNSIKKFRQKYPKLKVYSVCAEACASAAYYIAAATDQIYADEASLVGSIGVIYQGFGFVDSLAKLGVERRLIAAGRNKGFMDPFSPISAEQRAKFEKILKVVHEQFKQRVIEGRGKRLKIDEDTFSGIFWTGAQAKKIGLIDGFASPGSVARDILKQTKIINYTKKDNYFEQLARQFGDQVGSQLVFALSTSHFKLQ